jgi:FkbM family methyltransferase
MSMFNVMKFALSHPLNKDAKLSAIARIVKWQIGTWLVPGDVVFEWINGSRFLVRKGETGLTGNIYAGLHEFPDMGYLLHVLREDDLFVDVGANVGSYTILACSVRHARGIAFEPVPTTYKRLFENIRLNNLENRVQSFNVGIGRQQGDLSFTSDMGPMNRALAEGESDANAINIPVTTLDATLKGEVPSLLKIDVEGYETPVLEGAMEVLKNRTLHSVIMELNGSGSRFNFDEKKILEMMLNIGFKPYSYDPFGRVLINLKSKNLDSGNTLFIRNEEAVLERVKTAPKIEVLGKSF